MVLWLSETNNLKQNTELNKKCKIKNTNKNDLQTKSKYRYKSIDTIHSKHMH